MTGTIVLPTAACFRETTERLVETDSEDPSELRASLSSSGLTAAQRQGLVDRLITSQRTILSDRSLSDEEAVNIRVNLAIDLLVVAPQVDGSDLTGEVGIVPEGQAELRRARFAEARSLLDSVPVPQRTLETEIGVRFRLGRAILTFGTLADQVGVLPLGSAAMDPNKQQEYRELIGEFVALRGALDARTLRHVDALRAIACVRGAEPCPADLLDELRITLDDEAVDDVTRFRAGAAALDAAVATGNRPLLPIRWLDEPWVRRSAFLLLLAEDIRFRMARFHVDSWEGVAAASSYSAFLAATDLGLSRSEREQAVLARLRSIAVDYELSPPIIRLAFVDGLSARPNKDSMSVMGQSIEWLDRDSEQLPAEWQPLACWLVAEEDSKSGRFAEASKRFLKFAVDFTLDERAPEAARRAVLCAQRNWVGNPADSVARSSLREVLAFTVERFPTLSDLDSMIMLLVRILSEDGETEKALALLRTVTVASAARPEALAERVQVRLRHALRLSDPEARAQACRLVIDDASVARRELEASDSVDALRSLRLAVDLADAAAAIELRTSDHATDLLGRWSQVSATLTTTEQTALAWLHWRLAELDGNGMEAVAWASRLQDQGAPQVAEKMRLLAESALALTTDRWIGLVDPASTGSVQKDALALVVPVSRWCVEKASSRQSADLWILASALTLAGQPLEAAPIFDRAGTENPSHHASRRDVLLRAEAMYAVGRFSDAITLFRQVAALTAQERSAWYWRSELRTLQCMAAADRNIGEIYPRIQRLRRIDPELGGGEVGAALIDLEIQHRP